MTLFLTFALAGLATYLLRSCVVLAADRLPQSPRATTAIGMVAPAVLAAIVAASVFTHDGVAVLPVMVEVIALGAAVAAVRRTGNVSMALFVGLPVFWLASAIPL